MPKSRIREEGAQLSEGRQLLTSPQVVSKYRRCLVRSIRKEHFNTSSTKAVVLNYRSVENLNSLSGFDSEHVSCRNSCWQGEPSYCGQPARNNREICLGRRIRARCKTMVLLNPPVVSISRESKEFLAVFSAGFILGGSNVPRPSRCLGCFLAPHAWASAPERQDLWCNIVLFQTHRGT